LTALAKNAEVHPFSQDVEAEAMLKDAAPRTTLAYVAPNRVRPIILAVASGKGGVGKSFIVSNLGMALAQSGKRVVVVDLDLGGANLHTHLGITRPKHSLSHFISGKKSRLNQLIEPLPGTKLSMISGASDHLEIANLKHFQKQKIIRHISKLNADYVILDLGAGTAYNTLDFFNIADHCIISVIPEPTSIENGHRFLKCAMYRKLRSVPSETKQFVKEVFSASTSDTKGLNTLNEIIAAIQKKSPKHGSVLRRKIDSSGLHLIINQVRQPSDFQLGHSMSLIWKKFFGRKPDSLSFLNYDDSVVKALCEHRQYLDVNPHSRNAVYIKHLATILTNKKVYEYS
jgi:flagellar biosynthesis protein FlhG